MTIKLTRRQFLVTTGASAVVVSLMQGAAPAQAAVSGTLAADEFSSLAFFSSDYRQRIEWQVSSFLDFAARAAGVITLSLTLDNRVLDFNSTLVMQSRNRVTSFEPESGRIVVKTVSTGPAPIPPGLRSSFDLIPDSAAPPRCLSDLPKTVPRNGRVSTTEEVADGQRATLFVLTEEVAAGEQRILGLAWPVAAIVTQVPSVVVARVLGVSVKTAADWKALAGAQIEHL